MLEVDDGEIGGCGWYIGITHIHTIEMEENSINFLTPSL